MTARNYSNTGSDATVGSLLGPSDVSTTLGNYAGFPPTPYIAVLDPDTVDEEIVLVTNVTGTTATMTRAYDGTTAKSHSAGAVFRHVAAAKDFQEANDHVNATTGVHGVSGSLVGTTATQTLTNKTLTTPTISAPTITGLLSGATAAFSGAVSTGALTPSSVTTGAVSGTTGAFSGNVTVDGTLGVTGALSGSTASFSGLVTASTAPTAGGHLVNKTYADALGTAAATVSTIVRRDANADTAFRQVTVSQDPSTANALSRKSYVDAAIAAAVAAVTPQTFYDEGTGGGSIGTSAAEPADVASIIVPPGTWDVDYAAGFSLSISSVPRGFTVSLCTGSGGVLDTSSFYVNTAAATASRDQTGFARVTTTFANTTLTLRTNATGTGGTQSNGANKIRAVKVLS